jgi:signal transduction histidine kinase/CheY-like chemotaxis protein
VGVREAIKTGLPQEDGREFKVGSTLLLNALLLLIYFAAGKFGLTYFGLVHPSASPVWMPTGIAMAALLLYGFRLAPAVLVGAFLVNLSTAGSILSSLGVAGGNTLEALVGVWLVRRFAGGRNAFASSTGLLKFAGLAAGLATAVSATIGVASLTLGGLARAENWGDIWITWWLGNAAGAMLMTPLIVLWVMRQDQQWSRQEVRETVLLWVATGTIGAAIFLHPTLSRIPLAFVCFAPLVGGALRLGPRELSAAVGLLAVIATAATAMGHGPLLLATPNESLLVLQAFLIIVALTALPLSALTVERRSLLERERAARALADAASRAKDEFLAIVSHELRNPLAAISTAAAALDTGALAPRHSARMVESIRRQAKTLARLIDDLLDIGRATGYKLVLRKEPLELACVVQGAVDALVAARALDPQRIELALEPVWIDGDPARFAQIVENLVDNALKHTPAGRRIAVTVRADGHHAELRVEDEGSGIRPELLPSVFEPFFQAEQGLDRSTGGLGLGLTLARRLAELHGGTIEAASGGQGRGSSFVVRCPRLAAPAATPAAARQAASPPGLLQRLLIVEDNADARQALRTLLEVLGHEVHEAADGESGFAAALALKPDVVLIDLGLPQIDGYEVARRLRKMNQTMRLVALTGYGRAIEVQRAREAGFDEHLLKPATTEQLRKAIAGAGSTSAATPLAGVVELGSSGRTSTSN